MDSEPASGTRAARAASAAGALVLALVLAGPATAAAQGGPAKARVGLSLEYEHFSRTGDQLVAERNAFTAIPKFDWTPSNRLLLHLSGRLRKDGSDDERSGVDPYESFLGIERDWWSLRVGRQFISWGRADSFRPTDVFKRHDLTDLIENREEPADTVKLDFIRGSSTFEAVWAPTFDRDIYSLRPENRWTGLPAEVEVHGLGRVKQRYVVDRTNEPPRTLRSGQGAIRFGGSARGWDFAGMYYYGYDRIPTLIRAHSEGLDPVAGEATTTIAPIHERIHVVGGDMATVRAGWGLRAEGAYTRTAELAAESGALNEPYFRLTGGIDRSFSRIPFGESLSVIVQYALDTSSSPAGPVSGQQINPLLHPFRHALVVNDLWTFTEFKRLSVKGYVNLEDGDYVVQSEFSWQPADALTIAAGGDVLGGAADTFFGRFQHNDRLRLRLAYAF